MDTHSNGRSPMQSLLHSSSPREDGAYILTNHPEISHNPWSFNARSPTLSLERSLQDYEQLRLPPKTSVDNSSSMARFMTDDTSSRPLVELGTNPLGGINNGYLGHSPHLSISTSWGGGYQPSYHESADASSAVSSIYNFNSYPADTAASAWTGSPDSHRFRDTEYSLGNTSPTSPGYSHELSRSRGHPSMDGCLLPSSPGMHGTHGQQAWRRNSAYSTGSNSGNNSPGGTSEIAGAEISINGQGSYVNPKSIQLAPAEDEREEERDNDEAEEGCSSNRNGVPRICFHGPEHNTSSWCSAQGQYFIPQTSIECPASSSRASSPTSPQRSDASRHPRSGSGASQLSSKERAGLMKPYKDTIVGSTGKNHKGRGAGKKHKERQRCPEHPNKSFRHNSEFRYSPLPVPILPITSLGTRDDQLTIISSHSKHMQTQHTRPFLCTFYFANCAQTFGSKNEWKRHVFSQHLQLYYWRCDHVDCAARKAFFNRKDLFGQHLKRMHGPGASTAKNSPQMKDWLGQEIPRIQERCRKVRRSPPDWSKCGYCSKEFKGEGSWDLRMEHVGKHYEKNNYKSIDPKAWVMDEGLVEWAIGVGIVEKMECGNHKLICSGKDSIDGEEKRKSQMEQACALNDNGDDEDEDAEGEYE
ncbi:hypothetical protein Q9L58_009049 [Maublancomyces gigas]|uniref:C2H2 finger domain-containing protein n=1 Tax=Discina gigas TaxID=1032678 RepID=A0ABR3G8H2_9PEZI